MLAKTRLIILLAVILFLTSCIGVRSGIYDDEEYLYETMTIEEASNNQGGEIEVLDEFITELQPPVWETVYFVPQVNKTNVAWYIEFLITDGQHQIYKFPWSEVQRPLLWELAAVEIIDVDGDGQEDIIIIAYTMTGIGVAGAVAHSNVTVFFQREEGYVAYEKLDNELTYDAAAYTEDREDENPSEWRVYRSTTINDVLAYLNENISDWEHYLSDAEPYQ